MSKCVDFEDLKQCAELAIERGMSLKQFRAHMNIWTEFVDGYRWRYRHADASLDEWPEDCQQILLTIIVPELERAEVVKGAYFKDEGWAIDNENEYGEWHVLAWMPLPEPWKGDSE